MLSPLNPLKANSAELIPDVTRLRMLDIALKGAEGIKVSDIELSMPRPSYTVNTLRYLAKRYPRHSFKLIIGADNWKIFSQWKDAQSIIDDFGVVVYPRRAILSALFSMPESKWSRLLRPIYQVRLYAAPSREARI